MMNMRVT